MSYIAAHLYGMCVQCTGNALRCTGKSEDRTGQSSAQFVRETKENTRGRMLLYGKTSKVYMEIKRCVFKQRFSTFLAHV